MTTKEKILNLLKKESNLTAFEIATKTGLVMKSVSTVANVMVKDGLLSKVKDGKGVRFSPIEIIPELPKTVEEEKSELQDMEVEVNNDVNVKIVKESTPKKSTKKETKKNEFEDQSTVRFNSDEFRQEKKNKNWKSRGISKESYLGFKVGDKVKISDKFGSKFPVKGKVYELFICCMGYPRIMIQLAGNKFTSVSPRSLSK